MTAAHEYRILCRRAESCLPPAEYRTLLTELHDEMLADIEALREALKEAEEHLMNLQTIIANGLLDKRQREFIDPHIDMARAALTRAEIRTAV